MGAEILFFQLLPLGALLGIALSTLTWFRSHKRGARRIAVVLVIFCFGLVLPTFLFVAIGVSMKLIFPAPKLTVGTLECLQSMETFVVAVGQKQSHDVWSSAKSARQVVTSSYAYTLPPLHTSRTDIVRRNRRLGSLGWPRSA